MKRFLSFGVAVCLVMTCAVNVSAKKNEPAQIGTAPLNPMYEEYLQLEESEREGTIAPPMFAMPTSVNDGIMTMSELPTVYDLRDENAVPAVRNQLKSGSCWAFAGLASLESNLMLKCKKTYQFSPRHAEYSQVYQMKDGVNTDAFNRLADSGGSSKLLEAYLYRGVGPVAESDMPFTDSADSLYLSDIDLETSDVRLMDFAYLPYDTGVQSREDIIKEIKTALMDNGMVNVNIRFDYAHYNASTYALYANDATTVNHAVCIVGWDDNFSKTNFAEQPGTDGAWIVQNSWGDEWGDDGYFYLSYAQNIMMPTVVRTAQEGKNYDHIYYHDPLGFSQFMGFTDENYAGEAYAANVFETSPEAQQLTEVTVATAAFTAYQIYVNPKGASLAESDLTLAAEGVLDGTGYHTVELDIPLTLTGTKFAVAVHYQTPGVQYCVPVEARSAVNSYYSNVTSVPNASYLATSLQSNWQEISTEANGYANCCIKAYTQNTASCAKVTFQTAPSYARVTVKKDGKTLKAPPGGIYRLEPGMYTYSAQAQEYKTSEEKTFTVTTSDVSAGKKLRVTLTKDAVPPQIAEFQKDITYRLRTAQTADFDVELGTKSAAATGIQSVSDGAGNALVLGRDYTFQNNTLSLLSSYTDKIVLSEEDYAVLEGPSRDFTVVFNDAGQTKVPIRIKLRYASPTVCLTYVQTDLEMLRVSNATTQEDLLAAARNAFVNPNVEVSCVTPLKIEKAVGAKAGLISGTIYLKDKTTGDSLNCAVSLPIYPYAYDVKVTDGNGAEVNRLQSAQELRIQLNGICNGTADAAHSVYVAVYDGQGVMTGWKTVAASQMAKEDGTLEGSVTMRLQPQSKVCVMIWNNTDLCPLSEKTVWDLQ